jgi:phosphate transport system protein
MRTKYNEQLDMLNSEMKGMGILCENAISEVVGALVKKKKDNLGIVFDIEAKIDQKERDIENICMKLLLKQQPVASDLRMVSSALKMISDMERIGDQAADIAELVEYIDEADEKSLNDVNDMAVATIKMVTESIESFIQKDIAKTQEVIDYDDVVDRLFSKVNKDLAQTIVSNPEKSEICLDMLMIAKYFERIGDHATNIAEWVFYSLTGFHKNGE